MYKLAGLSIFVALCMIGSSMGDDVSGDTNSLLQKRLKDLGHLSLQNGDIISDDELFNKLFAYETMLKSSVKPSSRRNNMIMEASSSRSLDSDDQARSANKIKTPADLDSYQSENDATVLKKDAKDETILEVPSEKPNESPLTEAKGQQERPSLSKSSIDLNKAKSIAFNSREVRLVGPEKTEVEMKDDLASKVAVVFDNLRQETSQFLGEVNEKLDKGWTDFKQSVDKLVEQGKKQVSQLS